MTKCCFCKKEYKTYPVIISNNIEGIMMEDFIKDIYYNEEENIGVCETCRKKEFGSPVWRIRAWLDVRGRLYLKKSGLKKGEQLKMIIDALKRVKKYEQKLEETPEVKALYLKNNPAEFKKEPPIGKCMYCDENDAVIWINNPNEMEQKIENCWGVCVPCQKIIEKQSEAAFLMGVNQNLEKKGIDTKGCGEKRIEQLKKEIKEIAREDCQEVACFSITKDKEGTVKAKKEY